jgi:hypothetical protein
LLLQVAADAVQHLELEGRGGDILGAGEGHGLADDVLVVGGDPVVDPALQQDLGQLHVVGIDL